MPSKNTRAFVIPADIQREIETRTADNASATVATMLRRYTALLAESRSRNRHAFTPDELTFLRSSLSDAVTGASIEHALTVYTDALDADTTGIDLPGLMDRVAALSATDKIALVDSIERARIQERAGKRIIVTPV
jgi:hypothetical protein